MIVSAAYERRRLRVLAGLVRGRSVLDVGYAQQPNPYLQGVHRVGLDLRAPAPEGLRYDEEIVGDATQLASLLPGRTFDTILCAELIEHLENPYALLRSLRGALAPGGRLIVSTPNPLAPPVVVAELLRLRRFFYTRDHLYYFLPRWVERLFEASGYVVEEVRGLGLWTPLGSLPAPTALSYQVVYVGRVRAESELAE